MSYAQIEGDNLSRLWFNLLVQVVTGNNVGFYNPSLYSRRLYGYTEGIRFDKGIFDQDFIRYSGYNFDHKLSSLRKTYFGAKVEKQFIILENIVRDLQPRQARGLVSFSEPAFNKSDRLKCLDSLFIQKVTMTEYEALLIFRNTEIWPKLFMDFYFMYELLARLSKQRVKCNMFSCFLTSCFINMHQAPLAAMMLTKYGITSWNTQFITMLHKWHEKYGDPDIVETLTYLSIKRVVQRTHEIMEEDNIDVPTLLG